MAEERALLDVAGFKAMDAVTREAAFARRLLAAVLAGGPITFTFEQIGVADLGRIVFMDTPTGILVRLAGDQREPRPL